MVFDQAYIPSNASRSHVENSLVFQVPVIFADHSEQDATQFMESEVLKLDLAKPWFAPRIGGIQVVIDFVLVTDQDDRELQKSGDNE